MRNTRVYFDYAASTPVDPRVEREMQPYFTARFGNPGSLHSFGQAAILALDRSREVAARAVGAGFREVVFTGSATEANNMALRGALGAFQNERPECLRPRIVVSAIEHESILETAADLVRAGAEVVCVPVDGEGVVDLGKLAAALHEQTAVVSVMYANNEIGTVQPLLKVRRAVEEARRGRKYPLLHTDAAQAFQFLDCAADRLGVDMMTLSAHKIYGPKGVGALYIRNHTPFLPATTGGGQEFGWRSGTENVPLIAGFAKAVELALRVRVRECKRQSGLKKYFWERLRKICPFVKQNGPPPRIYKVGGGSPPEGLACVPSILSVSFMGYDAATLLQEFDLRGLAAGAGSACRARQAQPSHVLRALGAPDERVRGAIRFSFGRPTSRREIDSALAIIKMALKDASHKT